MTELAQPVASPRRASRRGQPVDLILFADQVDAALLAFATDVSFAVEMARAAVTIDRKRRTWQARKDLRAAETAAQRECRDTGAFHCHAESACGTGDCKFATGEHAALTGSAPGTIPRPQPSNVTGYSLEPAVSALAERRAATL